MANSPQLPPLKTWQFFHAIKQTPTMGIPRLQKLYKISTRQIDRWSANPRDVGDTRRNPLDRIETLLEELVEIGNWDVAKAAVTRMARIVGCELTEIDPAQPNQPTVEGECLEDYPAIVDFHDAIRRNAAIDEVMYLASQVRREIAETCEAYAREESRN